MVSSNAASTKTNFFHFPFQTKLNQQRKLGRAGQDTLEISTGAPKLNHLSKKNKARALAQGDEVGRKGGLWDCFGILGLLALCCVCCDGSGNAGYRGSRWANTPKPKNNTQPQANNGLASTANPASPLVSGTGVPPAV